MRFAVIATCAAGALAAPFAATAASARMDSDEFLTAVRCAAYNGAPALGREDVAALRLRLNAEARRQSAETVAQARADVLAIARDASAIDAGAVRSQRNIACGGAGMIADRNSGGRFDPPANHSGSPARRA